LAQLGTQLGHAYTPGALTVLVLAGPAIAIAMPVKTGRHYP
jgi:hypothetical protein